MMENARGRHYVSVTYTEGRVSRSSDISDINSYHFEVVKRSVCDCGRDRLQLGVLLSCPTDEAPDQIKQSICQMLLLYMFI